MELESIYTVSEQHEALKRVKAENTSVKKRSGKGDRSYKQQTPNLILTSIKKTFETGAKNSERITKMEVEQWIDHTRADK